MNDAINPVNVGNSHPIAGKYPSHHPPLDVLSTYTTQRLYQILDIWAQTLRLFRRHSTAATPTAAQPTRSWKTKVLSLLTMSSGTAST